MKTLLLLVGVALLSACSHVEHVASEDNIWVRNYKSSDDDSLYYCMANKLNSSDAKPFCYKASNQVWVDSKK